MALVQQQDVESPGGRRTNIGQAVGSGAILAVACLISYVVITSILTREYSVSRDDDFLGGMWAAVATIFVYRQSYIESARAAFSRTLATLASFVLCLIYLLIFPFHVVGMAALIGIISILLALIRRSEEIITAAITTAVVMVVAGISPQHAWIQPILRLVDSAVGILVGMAAAWIALGLGLSSKPQRSDA
ncbi:FUSC family protein [Acidicapsa acidisoli]|uniref:FUSC family protein n=1 Tax=Acidicapsa acidisoli TaxID=1615681 RepID=UPI0021E097AC|nr:FUSC family protein [Acidicapsa acidisoli]